MDVTCDRWRAISSTVGVSHLVCGPEHPTPLPEGVVGEIRAHEGEDGLICFRRESPFHKGDVVRITLGALCDQVGLFDCGSDADCVVLLLDLLGRQVKVKLPLDAVTSYP
jgi:transcriptional antiterminator RfaH